MTKDSKLTIIILALISLALLVLLGLDIRNIKTEGEETSRLLNSVDEVSGEEVVNRSIVSLQSELAEELDSLAEIAVADKEVVSVIERVESAGKELGLKTEIATVEKIEGESASRIKITVESEGAWGASFALLQAIENLPYLTKVERAQMSRNESNWRTSITFSLPLFEQHD